MAAAQKIKQARLADLAEKRTHLAELKREIKQVEDEIVKEELLIIHELKKPDGSVERGDFGASVDHVDGQRRPAWKDEFARIAGAAAVDEVIEKTPKTGGKDVLVLVCKGAVLK